MTKGEKPESAARIKRRSNVDIESYIKDLSPELQEKAHACGSVEELLALAKEAKIPVPDEALVAVAGGDDVDVGSCGPDCCPKCGHREKPYWSEWLDNGEIQMFQMRVQVVSRLGPRLVALQFEQADGEMSRCPGPLSCY